MQVTTSNFLRILAHVFTVKFGNIFAYQGSCHYSFVAEIFNFKYLMKKSIVSLPVSVFLHMHRNADDLPQSSSILYIDHDMCNPRTDVVYTSCTC